MLAGLTMVAVYLDNIVVHGPDLHIHDYHLHSVFSALLRNNLILNVGKCIFAAPAIEFVGFRLSAKCIEAVLRIPRPTSATQVASFLGMTAYYLWFLPHYSQTTAPLCQLLKKDKPWAWTASFLRCGRPTKEPAHPSPSLVSL